MVTQISPAELARALAGSAPPLVVDVREPWEIAIASLPGARPLDDGLYRELLEGERDTPLVFVCHHGIRSQMAALHFRELGFGAVANLAGGVDAWALEVDPRMPRY